ncbi:MAG: hypothetical protein Q8O40_09110 [Chloroflexota bacterium]|nr:hypothetical protein [Chloroflexota bacterium]
MPRLPNFALLGLLPLGMVAYVGFMNFLPFGREAVYTIDVGTKGDLTGPARVTAANRVGPRQSIEDTTFRELTTDMVYFAARAYEFNEATDVEVKVRFRPAGSQATPLGVGVREGVSSYRFQSLYDPTVEAVRRLPLVASGAGQVYSTSQGASGPVVGFEEFLERLEAGAMIATDDVPRVKALLHSPLELGPQGPFNVTIPPPAPMPVKPKNYDLLQQIAALPVVATGHQAIFAMKGTGPTSVADSEQYLRSLAPGSAIATDDPELVAPLLTSPQDYRPAGAFSVTVPEPPAGPVKPKSYALLQQIAQLPPAVVDRYMVFGARVEKPASAPSLDWFLRTLPPGSTIATDNPASLQTALPPPYDVHPSRMTIGDNPISCPGQSPPGLRVETSLREPHTLWTWVKGGALEFTVGKVDLNGYDDADPLLVEVYTQDGKLLGASTAPDDGVTTATRQIGPLITTFVKLLGLQEGPYRIALKGSADWLVELIQVNQEKLVVEGTVFLAGAMYRGEKPVPMIVYTADFRADQVSAKTIWNESLQTISITGEQKGALTLEAPDRWVSQPLGAGLNEIVSEKGNVYLSRKGFFSFTPCSWFSPQRSQVVALPDTLGALKASADYVVITDPELLKPISDPVVEPLTPQRTSVSCTQDGAAPLQLDLSLRGDYSLWAWVETDTLEFTLTKQDLNGYEGPDTIQVEVYSAAGQRVALAVVPDDGVTAPTGKLGPLQQHTVRAQNLTPGLYRIDLKGNWDFLIQGLVVNQRRLVTEGPVELAGGRYTGSPLKPAALYSYGLDKATLVVSGIRTEQDMVVVTEVDQQSISIGATSGSYQAALPAGFYSVVAKQGDITLSNGGFFSFSPCSWFLPRLSRVTELPGSMEALKASTDYVVITNLDSLRPVPEPQPQPFSPQRTDAGCPADTSGSLLTGVSLRGPHTFWTRVEGGMLELTLYKRDLNLYEGPDEVVIEIYPAEGDRLAMAIVADDGITGTTKALGREQSQRMRLTGLADGPYRIEVKGTSDFLIEDLKVNQSRLVVEAPVELGGGLYTGGPVEPVSLFGSAIREGSLTARTDHAVQQVAVISAEGQRTVSVDSLAKSFDAPLGPGFHAVVAEKGDITLDNGGFFSFTPCSWFLPQAYQVVQLTRDLATQGGPARYIALTRTDYPTPSVEKGVDAEWMVATVTWSKEEVFIPEPGTLQFAFTTPGGILVDRIEVKVKVLPLWRRGAAGTAEARGKD